MEGVVLYDQFSDPFGWNSNIISFDVIAFSIIIIIVSIFIFRVDFSSSSCIKRSCDIYLLLTNIKHNTAIHISNKKEEKISVSIKYIFIVSEIDDILDESLHVVAVVFFVTSSHSVNIELKHKKIQNTLSLFHIAIRRICFVFAFYSLFCVLLIFFLNFTQYTQFSVNLRCL